MQLYYSYKIDNNFAFLDEEEMQHVIKTLRKKVGDLVDLMDGKGSFYHCKIVEIAKRETKLQILSKREEALTWDFKIHLAIAPTKNIDRIEWLLEKAVEIGINEFTPIICRHSERKQLRIDRLEKIAIAAAKQSRKSFFTKINEAQDFDKLISNSSESQKFIAHCQDENLNELKNEFIKNSNDSVLILIGPEGDFSPEEIKKAEVSSFKSVSLGKSRLRTETAGLLACSIFHIIQ
jgi:16S rRNA (uracil1498-N3)-methyltransferase